MINPAVPANEPYLRDIERKFMPDPNKAVIYAAIFPGLGQIYNRKYWKLPLVYGSAIGCVYAITWNKAQYSGYKRAYGDFMYAINYKETETGGFNPERNSWKDYVRVIGESSTDLGDSNVWTAEKKSYFSQVLKQQRDRYRRYQDLSYIVSVGVYAIWIIDAYVDAQLFDFDIGDDLSMRVQPVIERNSMSKNTVGLQFSFNF